MSRRSRGKTRFERRRAHALVTKGRPGLLATDDVVSPTVAEARKFAPLMRAMEVPVVAKVTRRARCPECRRSEKVRKDGTLAKHTAKVDGQRIDCPGEGQEPARD